MQVAIGERRKPAPNGQLGYLRIDIVHQGDCDGTRAAYQIKAVDEVTQWQVVGVVAAISQAYLEPILLAILDQFPFTIRGFHSDNGREFINASVAALLKRMLIAQTKSRPRRSNDNAMLEFKNGAVIRKHMGYGYTGQEHAQDIDAFYRRSSESLSKLPSSLRPAGTHRRSAWLRDIRLSGIHYSLEHAAESRSGSARRSELSHAGL